MATVNVVRLGPTLESKSLTVRFQSISWYTSIVNIPGEENAAKEVAQMKFGDYTFQLTIEIDRGSQNILVWIQRGDVGNDSVRADHLLELINQDRRLNVKHRSGGMKLVSKGCIQYSLGVFSQLLAPGFVRDDALTFLWTVTMPKKDFDPDVQTKIANSASDRFNNNICTLLDTGKFSDMVLLVESCRIPVHSQILAAQSPVFAAMLDHDMQERRSRKVQIDGLSADSVHQLLTFMYSGRVNISPDEVDDYKFARLQAAHRYQVSGLVDICVCDLSCTLTCENVALRLVQADTLGEEMLKKACLDFMVGSSSRLSEIQETPGYHVLSTIEPHLAVELLAAAFPREPASKRARMETPEAASLPTMSPS
mmetsp:Transcript_99388/g.186692  ORF Transcript_99388/g.186692 Transcript_99388/m.186692 type:complete len:367 (-) Transcript_99388:256-1356(-)